MGISRSRSEHFMTACRHFIRQTCLANFIVQSQWRRRFGERFFVLLPEGVQEYVEREKTEKENEILIIFEENRKVFNTMKNKSAQRKGGAQITPP